MKSLAMFTVPMMKLIIALFAVTAFVTIAAAEPQGHQHATKGPKGGAIVELGAEELHAELLHDDEAQTVTVYLLDGKAKGYVSVTTPEIMVSVRMDGRTQQFRLNAKPQKGDRAGQTSRFEVKNPALVEMLDDHHAEAKLALKVGKRSYAGVVPHIHDHEHGDEHNRPHAH